MKIVAFVIALVFFVGGIVLFGYVVGAGSAMGVLFFCGVLAVVVSLAVPFHLLKRLDR